MVYFTILDGIYTVVAVKQEQFLVTGKNGSYHLNLAFNLSLCKLYSVIAKEKLHHPHLDWFPWASNSLCN